MYTSLLHTLGFRYEYLHCVGLLAIMPPQGCEAILFEILQPKRFAAGPHFTRCFLINKHTTDLDVPLHGILTLILLGHASFV